MNKTKIWSIVTLLSLSLIGLIFVQVFWIDNAVKLKEERFNQSVNEAMTAVAARLEKHEIAEAIEKGIPRVPKVVMKFDTTSFRPDMAGTQTAPDSAKHRRSSMSRTPVEFNRPRSGISRQIGKSVRQIPDSVSIHPSLSTRTPAQVYIIHRSPASGTGQQNILPQQNGNNVFHQEVNITQRSMATPNGNITITHEEVRFGQQALNVLPVDTPENPIQILIKAPEQEVKHTEPSKDQRLKSLKRITSQVVVEMAGGARPIQERVSSAGIDSLLHVELLNRGISLPFEFTVSAGPTPVFAKPDTAHITENGKNKVYMTALFPNDIISHSNTLSLMFPGQQNYLLQSMWTILLMSLLFILLIVFSFGFTVRTLFRQKKLSDMTTDFINNMTHEFKTPIATISLASEALNDPEVAGNPQRLSRFVRAIYDENKRLGSQVEKVLQAAVLERGDFKLAIKEVSVHTIIEKALRTIEFQVEAKHGLIVRNLKAEGNTMNGDEVHLTNIVNNLLDNANKYSPDAPHITVSTWNTGNELHIAIEDEGIGMSKEAQKRVFEKFYRVPTGNLHDVKGFGLGLSYVKTMVEAHGGSISVQSEAKKGSRFEIIFPLSA